MLQAPEDKVLTLEAALAWRERLCQAGRHVVVTNGCFDLLHPGHVDYLNRSRNLGDALLVAINSDASLRRLKGPERPIFPEDHRTLMLGSLAAVDVVLVFDTPDCVELLRQLRPDTYVKGGDYTADTINQAERAALAEVGARLAFLPFLPGYSSSALLARLRRLSD
jgi:D-glycero-beta-D-manno-heptose 1-phosphate adenylyltransferase